MSNQPEHERHEASAMASDQIPSRILVGIFDSRGEARRRSAIWSAAVSRARISR
jgi:hypothetical protein